MGFAGEDPRKDRIRRHLLADGWVEFIVDEITENAARKRIRAAAGHGQPVFTTIMQGRRGGVWARGEM